MKPPLQVDTSGSVFYNITKLKLLPLNLQAPVPSPKRRTDTMINVTICGHDSHHPSSFCMEHSRGLPDYLFLLVKTDAWFILDGKKVQTGPNMAILFDRNAYICYGCDHENYNDDWIHFDFSEGAERSFMQKLQVPFGTPLYLPQIGSLSRYVQLMTPVFHGEGAHRTEMLDALMRALLCALDEQFTAVQHMSVSMHRHYSAFQNLRTGLYNDPAGNWNISGMAASLYLSPSYFQHLYKEFFHCSCQQDIIRARLELAKFHLSNSDMSIRGLAEFCGYGNELHFMRQFKKFEGMTPSEFRSAAKRGL